jgi:hypothetical protein
MRGRADSAAMRTLLLAAVSLTLTAAAPFTGKPWLDGPTEAIVSRAGIAVPKRAASMTMKETLEASQQGQGVDTVAQYESTENHIDGTAYIFFNSYADAALSAIATDRAIKVRFGPDVHLADERVVAAGGVAGSTIRRIYEGGVNKNGAPIITTAAFMHAGQWTVVLRVSSPVNYRAEAEKALDALIAGVRFKAVNPPQPATVPAFGDPCPGPVKDARFRRSTGADALAAGLLGGSIMTEQETGKKSTLDMHNFPDNGARKLCARGNVEGLLILGDAANKDRVALALIDDAGGILSVEPQLIGGGYQVKRYGIGFAEVLGNFDRMPTDAQLGAIHTGKDTKGGQVISRTVLHPEGGADVQVDPSLFK